MNIASSACLARVTTDYAISRGQREALWSVEQHRHQLWQQQQQLSSAATAVAAEAVVVRGSQSAAQIWPNQSFRFSVMWMKLHVATFDKCLRFLIGSVCVVYVPSTTRLLHFQLFYHHSQALVGFHLTAKPPQASTQPPGVHLLKRNTIH